MPYIISTINECTCCDERKPGLPGAGDAAHLCGDCSDSDGCVAVATLDEARLKVAGIYDGFEYTDVDAAMDNCWEAENLPAEGKTIGPLPDGTVIEVRQAA